MPKLIVTTQGIPQTYELVADISTLGRGDHSMIQIRDNKASRDHAQILKASGTFWLIDRGSHNGTLVNGQKITRHGLKNGDVVAVGLVTCIFIDDVAPVAAAPAAPAAPTAAPAAAAAAKSADGKDAKPAKEAAPAPAPAATPADDGFQSLDQEVFDRIRGIFGSGQTPSQAIKAAKEGPAGGKPAPSGEKKPAAGDNKVKGKAKAKRAKRRGK
jgi:predicted component of type VI protein secretion system